MALDADLSVDVLADNFIVALNADFAPFSAFSTQALSNTTRVGRNTVQLEISNTLPTAGDNRVDYQTGSGDNANRAVTVAEVSVAQEITSQEQLQGHLFQTAVGGMTNSLMNAVWDDVTPVMTTANFANATSSPTATASFDVAEAQGMWGDIDGATEVNLLVTRAQAAVLLPDNMESYDFRNRGAYGFNGIHAVTDFTGGQANLYAFACAPQAIVMVGGAPSRHPDVISGIRNVGAVEQLNLDVGLSVEMTVWTDTQTRSLWMGLSTCVGFAQGDSGAAVLLLSV